MADGREDGGTPAVDRISALPDDVLHLVLSWLPTDEAVRTSLLARRWRQIWRSARVTNRGGKKNWTPLSLTNFVSNLLLLRAAGSPMDELEISCGRLRADRCYDDRGCCYCEYDDRVRPLPSGVAEAEDLSRSAATWIRHALSICNARALNISFFHTRRHRLRLDGVLFVSQVLTRVVLTDAAFDSGGCLDFSRCPALVDLAMSACTIHVDKILSKSLRRLSITECGFGLTAPRTRVSTPRLLSLELSVASGKTPFLEKMPLLEAARVRLCGDECADMCVNDGCSMDCNGASCDGGNGSGDDGGSVLLEGLSGATDLDLTSHPRVFIFRRDCKFSTIFANLKTLVLNEWCMVADSRLVYFLQYSPILEKLTIQLEYCETEDAVVVTDENYSPTENVFVSRQLKVVHIKCHEENKLVAKVLRILGSYGVPPERINVDQNFYGVPPEIINVDQSFRPPTICSYQTSDSEDYY